MCQSSLQFNEKKNKSSFFSSLYDRKNKQNMTYEQNENEVVTRYVTI